jgi:hypothetical protein
MSNAAIGIIAVLGAFILGAIFILSIVSALRNDSEQASAKTTASPKK